MQVFMVRLSSWLQLDKIRRIFLSRNRHIPISCLHLNSVFFVLLFIASVSRQNTVFTRMRTHTNLQSPTSDRMYRVSGGAKPKSNVLKRKKWGENMSKMWAWQIMRHLFHTAGFKLVAVILGLQLHRHWLSTLNWFFIDSPINSRGHCSVVAHISFHQTGQIRALQLFNPSSRGCCVPH